jgi:hypothetical protein
MKSNGSGSATAEMKKPPHGEDFALDLLTETLRRRTLKGGVTHPSQEPAMLDDKLGQPPPLVQSMILADYVHRDSMTGKRFILGTYNSIVSTKFPHGQPVCLFVAITDAHGLTLLRLRIVDVDEQFPPIHESSYPVEIPDPNQVYEMTFTTAVIFPAPGDYRIQLLAGNETLRELRLRVGLSVRRPPAAAES